jgi:hypothetical protein
MDTPQSQEWLFGIIGLLFFIVSIVGLRDALLPLSWRKVKGKILSSRITSREVQFSEPESTSLIRSLQARYEYEVDGQRYVSSRIARSFFGEKSNKGDYLYGYLSHASRYQIGASVDVYVCPDDPGESVLVRLAIGPLVMFSLFLIVAAIYLVIVIFHIPVPVPEINITSGGE